METNEKDLAKVRSMWKPNSKQAEFLAIPHTIKEAAYLGGAGSGKLLPLNCLVLTPNGYKEIQYIHKGDYVIGRDGQEKLVIGETEHHFDQQLYKLTFENDEIIYCGGNHLWTTWSEKDRSSKTEHAREQRRATRWTPEFINYKRPDLAARMKQRTVKPYKGTVRATKEMFETQLSRRKSPNYTIEICQPVQLSEKKLPIPPYILGCWLGDGTSATGGMTIGQEDFFSFMLSFNEHGFNLIPNAQNGKSYNAKGLNKLLKRNNLRNNKHIPEIYFLGSESQRRELLQGLLDTDGHCYPKTGQVEFCNTNLNLIDGVFRLASSLGIKCKIRKSWHSGNPNHAQAYTVNWINPYPVFKLERKKQYLPKELSTKSRFHYILKIEKVENQLGKCLQVEDREYLITKSCIPTHNSDLLLMFGIVNKWHEVSVWKQVFMRRTYPELKNEILGRSREIYSKFGATFNKTDMIWTFPRMDQYGAGMSTNAGAQIFLGHCEHEDDVHQYDSMQISLFTPDEITSFTQNIYNYITFERNRSPQGYNLPSITRCAGMPGGVGHCVKEGEILTPNGWIDIKELRVGDSVYEVNPNTFNLEESIIEQYHAHEFEGNLYQAHTTNLDIECTPRHRVLRLLGKKGRDNNYTLTPVSELPNQANICRSAYYSGDNNSIFTVPSYDTTQYKRIVDDVQPKTIPYHLYAQFMGWFLAEGWTLNESYNDSCFGIAQSKLGETWHIKMLLDECGFVYTQTDKGFVMYGRGWYNYLKQFGKCEDKFIPRALLNSNKTCLRNLFNALMLGDGHFTQIDETSGHYYTSSKQLQNDFAELAFKLGYSVKCNQRQRDNRNTLSYQVYFTSQFTTEILKQSKRKSNVTEEYYKGLVYDIGVPKYHTFVIRQKGSIWISGNSWVKKRFVDPYKPGGKIIKGKGGNKRIFIHATFVDNQEHIDPTYGKSLDGRPEAERKAKKFGDFDAYLGQVFEEFRDKKYADEPDHAIHVIKPFEIPEYWPKFVIIDWGFRANNWVGFFAVAPTKRLYLYRELTWTKTKISEWGPIVRSFMDIEHPKLVKVCKSAGQDRGQEHTIQTEIERELGPVVLTTNSMGSRVAGKTLLHEYFRWTPKPKTPIKDLPPFNYEKSLEILRIQGNNAYISYLEQYDEPVEEVLPKYQIFCCEKQDHTHCENCCPNAIEAIKSCSYSENTKGDKPAEDVAEFSGDDAYDGQRYAVDTAEQYFQESADEFEKFRKQQALEEKLRKTGDWTGFYRTMEHKHKEDVQPLKMVRVFHGRGR